MVKKRKFVLFFSKPPRSSEFPSTLVSSNRTSTSRCGAIYRSLVEIKKLCWFCISEFHIGAVDLLEKIRRNFSNIDSNRKSRTRDVFALVHFRSALQVLLSFSTPEEPLDFSWRVFLLNFELFWHILLIFEPIFRFRHTKKIKKKWKFKNRRLENPRDTTLFSSCRVIKTSDPPTRSLCVFRGIPKRSSF